MDLMNEHERDIEDLRKIILENARLQRRVSHTSSAKRSNIVREKPYTTTSVHLPLEKLNRVLNVDVKERYAYVEPCVTMDALVRATLPYGLMPPVVPEFKTITVGGAINGTALESSSHRHGQFNDCCRSYDLILGDGTSVEASPEKASDLFYGLSGSYGSLAVVAAAKINLVPASGWVRLNYRFFSSVQQAVAFMNSEHDRSGGPDFIEAIVYDAAEVVVITGSLVEESNLPEEVARKRFNRWWSRWYYLHVRQQVKKGVESEAVPLYDYLFRSDRGAFWMGGYALHKPLLLRYILEYCGRCPKFLDRWLLDNRRSRYTKIKEASLLFRLLLGAIMSSKRLYALLHGGTERWFADHFVIQDYYLPEGETTLFVHEVLARFGVKPLWLCPVKATATPQIFSPHAVNENGKGGLLYDVGVYGMADSPMPAGAVSAELDHLTAVKGGRKMLYSYTSYSEEYFWELYDRAAYEKLCSDYLSKKLFHEITEKVLLSKGSSDSAF